MLGRDRATKISLNITGEEVVIGTATLENWQYLQSWTYAYPGTPKLYSWVTIQHEMQT